MMCSELRIRTSLSLCVTRHVSFTHHIASSVSTTKTLLGHPCDVSCLDLCTKLMWWAGVGGIVVSIAAFQNLGCPDSCLQSSFTGFVKKFCSPSSFADLESCCPWPNLRAVSIRQQDLSPWGRAGTPFLDAM
jgi:hypothetical protein